MADSAVFEWACAQLERDTTLNRLQARGTMRLILGAAGLEPGTLNARQLKTVATRLLPKELRARGVQDIDALTEKLTQCPPELDAKPGAPQEPEDIFKRLGRPK